MSIRYRSVEQYLMHLNSEKWVCNFVAQGQNVVIHILVEQKGLEKLQFIAIKFQN